MLIRKSTRYSVEQQAERLPDGRFLGRLRDYAESQFWTQKQFNDFMNDPALYQIEDPITNRSHVFEMTDAIYHH